MRFLSYSALASTRRVPVLVKRMWSREYHDVKLILEQRGDLKYFNIPAGFQRFAARGFLIASAFLLGLILFLAIASLLLGISRARLEKSHEEVYRALLTSSVDANSPDTGSLSEEQMITLAQTIRDRDMSIRRFVETSMVAVSEENETIKTQLESSGLTEKIVRIIQQNSANGGYSPEGEIQSNPLL